jgi:hypothetical protein
MLLDSLDAHNNFNINSKGVFNNMNNNTPPLPIVMGYGPGETGNFIYYYVVESPLGCRDSAKVAQHTLLYPNAGPDIEVIVCKDSILTGSQLLDSLEAANE